MSHNALTMTLTIALTLSCAQSTEAAEVEPPYIIDAMIIAIRTDNTSEAAIVNDSGEQLSISDSLSSSGVTEIRVGDLSLTLGDRGPLLWNGSPEPPVNSGVEILASPRLQAMPGQQAVVRTGARLQYFEARDDGAYALRVTQPETAPGVEFRCAAKPTGGDADRVILDYDLKLVVLEGRESVPGVDLDVGYPILRTRQVADRLLLDMDRWSIITGHFVSDVFQESGYLLICLVHVQRPQ